MSSSFCAERYGSALLHWLKATKYVFAVDEGGLEHPVSRLARAAQARYDRIYVSPLFPNLAPSNC